MQLPAQPRRLQARLPGHVRPWPLEPSGGLRVRGGAVLHRRPRRDELCEGVVIYSWLVSFRLVQYTYKLWYGTTRE